MAAPQNSRRGGSGKGFVPPQFAKLVARYQSRPADFVLNTSSVVTSWLDSSGNNRHLGAAAVTTTLQTVNGLPYLAFPSAVHSGNLSNATAFPTGSYTLIMRLRNDVRHDNMALFGTSGGNFGFFYKSSGTTLSHYQNTYIYSASSPPLGAVFTAILTFDASTGIGTLYIDGIQAGSGSGGGANTSTQALDIGNYGSGTFPVRDCLIGECVVYSIVLTAASRAAWFNYLATR